MRSLSNLLALTVALTGGTSASAAPSARASDFVLTARDGKIVDRSGRIPSEKIKVENVEVVSDPRYGEVMRIGSKGFACVTIADEGKISMKEGLTVDAWVYLEEPVTNTMTFAMKNAKDWVLSTFQLELASGNYFTLSHINTGSEKIDFTRDELPYNWALEPYAYYPGRHGTCNGCLPIATGEWTRVTFTYDAATRAVRTWVNGSLDREGFDDYLCRGHELYDEDDQPLVLFRGMHGVRVAGLSFSPFAKTPGYLPPVRVYVHESPYRTGYVHIRPLDKDLPFPVEVEVQNGAAGAGIRTVKGVLTGMEGINVDIPPYVYGNAKTDLFVKLRKKGREIYRYQTLVMNPELVCSSMTKWYQGIGTWTLTNPDWKFDSDLTLRYKGKPHFPLLLYFGNLKDWDLLTKDLGFNMIQFRKPKTTDVKTWRETLRPYYDKAAEQGVTISDSDELDDDVPAQGIRLGQDEPYSLTFAANRDGYMEARNGRKHGSVLPLYATQNNWHRYRETAQVCDVFAPDPYARGRYTARFIYDSMKAAAAATDGRKYVMCVMGNYGTDPWRPDAEEFRMQCYMAVIGGARGLAFYSWDEGDEPGGNTDTATKPNQLASYRSLFAEFRELDTALTTPNLADEPTVEPAEPRGVFACLKKGRDGKTYLFVASDLFRTTTHTLSVPAAAGRTATLLYGGTRSGMTASLKFSSDGKAQLAMPPISAGVYRFEK